MDNATSTLHKIGMQVNRKTGDRSQILESTFTELNRKIQFSFIEALKIQVVF